MAVRIDASGDSLSRTLPGGANITLMAWFYLTSDRNANSSFISIGTFGLQTGADGTTMQIVSDLGTTTGLGLSVGVWTHLAMVRSSTQMRSYVNGVLDITRTLSSVTGTLYFGNNASSHWLDGRVSCVKMWQRALAVDEMLIEASSMRPLGRTSLFAWAPLAGTGSARLLDPSQLGNALTENGTLTDEDGPPIGWGGRTWFMARAAAGGASYNQSNTGTLTPTGVPLKRTNTVKVGSLTPAAVLIKRTNTTKTGSLTPTGVLIKQARKFFTGALTPAGAMTYTRGYIRTLTGSLTPTGEIIRSVGKRVAGVLTPAGAVIKATSKRFVGSLTPSGFLAAFTPIIIQLGGTLAPAAALIKRTSKYPAGLLIPAGALVRAVAKYLVGALTSTGAISTTRGYIRTVTGALTPAGAIVKQAGKQVAGVLTPTGAIIRATSFHVAGLLAPAGAVVKRTSKFFSGALSFVGSLLGTTIGRATISHSLVYGATMTQRSAYGAGMTFSLVGGASIEVT